MYEYIKGKLVELNPAEAIIEAGGIGYKILISLGTFTELQNSGEEAVKLFIYHYLREDDEGFYGFCKKEERTLFLHLISVSGVGAATARTILSSMSADELSTAILTQDVNRIKGVKGIGLKTAQRLILELKDKVGKGPGEDFDFGPAQPNPVRSEAVNALVLLGFAKPAAEKAVEKVLKDNPGCGIECLIKNSLKIL